MARPNRLPEIEQEHGEKLDTLIPRLLNELGTMPAVAAHLGTTLQTIANWCAANGIEKHITWVKRDNSEPEAV
jgi:hypothetical protein